LTATPPYRKETFMAVPAHRLLLRIALPLLALATLSGCATRYDSEGRRIYFLQFGRAQRLAATGWREVYAYIMHEPTAPVYAQALMKFASQS
jgi:hypothetical protein